MTKDHSPIPAGYSQLLAELKHTVAAARWRAQRVINTEMVQYICTSSVLWRRTQPVDDPWAEEYWEDATTVTTPTPAVAPPAVTVTPEAAESAEDADTTSSTPSE